MTLSIDTFFSQNVRRFTDELGALEQQIGPDERLCSAALVERLASEIHQMSAECAELELHLAGEEPSVLKNLQARFRDAIWPWFGKSWFMERALTKPRGYPGDYEMLSAIYDGQPKSRGLGACLDQYFLQSSLGRAVVARMESIRTFLLGEIERRSGKVSVLNIASGPCREYTPEFTAAAGAQVQITCIDNDELAIDFAKHSVMQGLSSNVSMDFVVYNALRMASASGNIRRFGRRDVIYSVGLYDYIPDSYLIPLLQGLRESLTDGGVMYVAFKDSRRYDKTEYQWFVDWYFFQRTEEECRELFVKAGYDMDAMEMTRDATGVIINFIARCRVPVEASQDESQTVPAPQSLSTVSEAAPILH